MSTKKKFLSLEDVANLLDVNYQLIYRLVRKGELPAVRIGRVYRVTREDLEDYLASSKTTAQGGCKCSSCGTVYASAESLKFECEECSEPICFDCWKRKDVRRCAEHQ